jgi:hypothetical protein
VPDPEPLWWWWDGVGVGLGDGAGGLYVCSGGLYVCSGELYVCSVVVGACVVCIGACVTGGEVVLGGGDEVVDWVGVCVDDDAGAEGAASALCWACLRLCPPARGAGTTFSDTGVPEKRAARLGSPAGTAWDASGCEGFAFGEALLPAAREIPKAAPKATTTHATPVPASLSTREG